MSQNSTSRHINSNAVTGPDFNLPDEILSIMPTDPYEQLDLARKITSMAIASRVSKLESETERMKHKIYEKDQVIFELEDKVSRMEQSFKESENRLKIVLDENMKLSKERDSLTMTTRKLSRDLVKLATFKRQLMQSLSDDNSSQAETVDIETCEQPMPKAYIVKDGETNGYESQQSYSSSNETGQTIDEVSKHAGKIYSITPYITPRLTPTGTPKVYSTTGSPRAYSAVGSPLKGSGRTSPIKSQYEGQPMLSSWYSTSQQSSAASSPPRGRPNPARAPRIDGKEFFRQARSLLSYEQFSAFLANVKEFNAQKQSREVTLRKAEEIFGNDNKHLYLSFQGLLNRNIH